MSRKHLIVIVGPTAIGKTSLSLALAQKLDTEIISADSRQIYRELSIGTAAPKPEELAAAPHHFIHHRSVAEPYSVGDFQREALSTLDKLFSIRHKVILVGGSGLYVDAVTKGLDHFPEVDPQIRTNLNLRLQNHGLSSLQEELSHLDPNYYSEVDLQNPHRVIRALEISIGTGKPFSSFRKKNLSQRPFKALYIGLTADRETIYGRINQRVDLMMEQGLLEEVEQVFEMRHLNALNTVGYKELFKYLEGHWSLETAIEEIKKNTRRFAKRQLTWFKKNPDITWFDYKTPPEEIALFIKNRTCYPASEEE